MNKLLIGRAATLCSCPVLSRSLLLWAAAAAGATLLASCADTYGGGETFESTVTNTQLASPAERDIVITPSTDGSQQTISWPVVHGAGGYEAVVYDLSNEKVGRDTIDGCALTIERQEDTNYRLELRTLGNVQLGNRDAETATVKEFTTFEEKYATIPAGDLAAYFAQNPIPADSVGMNLIFDLTPGAQYTLSAPVDFYNHRVTLRTPDKVNLATITYGQGATIATCAGLTLKNLAINGEATTEAIITLSEAPDPAILDADHNNHNQITDPITIQGCRIDNVVRQLIFDNKVKYCIKTMLISDTQVKFTPDDKMASSSYILMYDGGGFINDFTAVNSTFWANNDNKVNYFIRYNNSGRCDRAGYLSNSINMRNCTFYNIAKAGQMCNHGGFDGKATSNYDITNNIFVDCGNGQVPRRITGRINANAQNNFAYNTYWFDGAPETEGFSTSTYDASGNALQTDPAFANAASGNFTPTGAEQVERKTGDPRWLAEN